MEERSVEVGHTLVFSRPSSRSLLTGLIAIIGFLVTMHLLSGWSDLQVLQNHWLVHEESTVPTWWSSIQLLGLAVLVLLLAITTRGRLNGAFRSLGVLSAVFAFFSIDEVATLHESITIALSQYEAVPRFSGDHGIWIVAYGLIGLTALAWLLPGLITVYRHDRRRSWYFVLGGGVFVAGGVGVEVFGYLVSELVLLEETLEMLGVSIMVWVTYSALDGTEFRLDSQRPETSSSLNRSDTWDG